MDINYLFDQGHKNWKEACGHVEKPKIKLGLHDRAQKNFREACGHVDKPVTKQGLHDKASASFNEEKGFIGGLGVLLGIGLAIGIPAILMNNSKYVGDTFKEANNYQNKVIESSENYIPKNYRLKNDNFGGRK